MAETLRDRALRVWSETKRERDLWLPVWRDAVDFVVPWRGRFMPQKGRPEGRDFGADIVNSVATRSVTTGAAGMMSSLTSPARPWFRLTTADTRLAEVGSVKQYLDLVQRLIQWVFARSNIHNELHVCYRDLLAIGTAPLYVDEDPDDVIRAYVLPVGQYGLACNSRQRVDSCGRDRQMTVRQMLQAFGEERCSQRVRKLKRDGNLNQSVDVVHLVVPNEDLIPGAFGTNGKRWLSLWMETAEPAPGDPPFLARRGYNQFPVMAGRWEVTGTEDVYGHAAVREVMPDIKQLQHVDTKKIELIDKVLTPPVQSPPGVDYPSMLTGAMTVLPAGSTGAKIEPIYEPPHQAVQEGRAAVAELEYRIRQGLHEDLWRAILDRAPDTTQPGRVGPSRTAYEIAALQQERLTLLGPNVERMHNELLSPLIKRTVAILAERQQLPPPPRELVEALVAGDDVKIEYLSVLAQAQRLLGLGSLERFASIVRALAPDLNDPLWDKVDRDEFIDQASDMLGTPPSVVRSDEDVMDMRLVRARRQKEAEQAAQMESAAKAARDLGQTPASGDTALSRIVSAQYGPAVQGALGYQPKALA